ncbi:MAG: hypothetical protein HFH69_01935 [Lachnospiraceae bacterium]|jgi:hypothetical protein|uniref:hypothetical protein n=1 Tax=uncultured Bacteroides sp. TaxID=162156 RepID=UPI00272A9AF4|nr:hypothetical protein [uncultured Bacteroides sp.]MCI8562257.1 hypothetical protein [Lachnospiraceae bacterium]
MNLTLNVRERKPLVRLISRFTQEDAVYMRTPTYAYRIGGYIVTREGDLETPDGLDSSTLHALYEALAGGGYYPKEPEPVTDTSVEEGTDNAEAEEVADRSRETEEISIMEEITERVGVIDKTPPGNTNTSASLGLPADVLNRLNALRTSLIREINRQFNGIMRVGDINITHRNIPMLRENVGQAAAGGTMSISLYGNLSTLRGTKPTLVRYGDESIPVASWKRAFAAVLDICNRQEHYHEALLSMRSEIVGRGRKVIADSPAGMLSPLEVDNGLYVETNFSTEALLKMLRDRILYRIDFDGSSISFEYWRP